MTLPFDIAADLDTPVSAYLKLRPFRPRFLLESVEQGLRLGRYSFIGFGDCFEVRLDRSGFAVNGDRRPRPADGEELLAGLREALLRAPRPQPHADGIPLAGGLVGYSAYDLARSFERLPAARGNGITVPEACYVAPKSLLVFDHVSRGVTLLHDGDEAERESLRREIVAALAGPLPRGPKAYRHSPAAASLARGEFEGAVGRARGHIAAGDVYQLVLSVRFEGECEHDPFEVYRALRLLNPSPYMYFVEAGGLAVAGSSPEALVRLTGRRAELRPIAGTRPRGGDLAEDRRHAEELLADAKEGAEHVMLVDLARNDLGRVARAGSIRVNPYRSIERYSHVMHLVSGVDGELASGRDAFDLFAAAFPAGTLVGAPKVRAMELIDELEPVGRGLYGGTVGYFGNGGDMDQAITIRTMVFGEGRYSYQAGAGIVADSDPAREHAEVLAKSAVMRRALEVAGAGL
ncbi:MAG TPA: anthranilate synthase component I family protein [Steroidobacteraceae bacterium]|jgi:anthranilate synthase component 1